MKKYFFLLAFILCLKSYSQIPTSSLPPYIEVTGSAEIAVKPDIYFINLRIVTKLFNGISSQEKKVGNELTKAGIKSTDFSLTTISYDFRTLNMQPNDRAQNRDYILRIQTEKQLTDIFNALDEAGIDQSFVSGVDYTKKTEVINKLGIDAMKNASDNAFTILSSIDGFRGKTLSIVEVFSGPQLFNDGLPSPYNNTLQQQNDSYMYNRAAFQRNYESILYKVSYRVKYSIIE